MAIKKSNKMLTLTEMNKKIKKILGVMLTSQINVKGKVDIFIINIF